MRVHIKADTRFNALSVRKGIPRKVESSVLCVRECVPECVPECVRECVVCVNSRKLPVKYLKLPKRLLTEGLTGVL
jgi:hypothetical protein